MVYDSPDNADLRRRRPNPNRIQPGDVLILPDVSASSPPPAGYGFPGILRAR